MSYSVRIDALALRDIDQFATYLGGYSETFALEQIERIDAILRNALSQSPTTWSYFFVTGAPYRAYLFRVGRRTILDRLHDRRRNENRERAALLERQQQPRGIQPLTRALS